MKCRLCSVLCAFRLAIKCLRLVSIILCPAINFMFSSPAFPEDRDITICPAIIISPSRPSFRLEPVSAMQDERFLLGTYDAPDTAIIGAVIETTENSTCTNNSDNMCSKLSLRYCCEERRGIGLFTITYTASNRVTRRIRVKFGEFE